MDSNTFLESVDGIAEFGDGEGFGDVGRVWE